MKTPKTISLNRSLTLLIISIVLTASITYVLASSSSGTFTISQGIYPGAPNYTVWKEGSTYYAKDAWGYIPTWGKSSDAVMVMQTAINALTAGRTWKETVLIKGNIITEAVISIVSYTRIVIDGSITLKNNSNARIFQNSDDTNGNEHIEIVGGILNHGTQTSGSVIYFKRVWQSKIEGVVIKNAKWCGIHLVQCGEIDIVGNTFLDGLYYTIWVEDHTEFGSVLRYGGKITDNFFLNNANNIILYARYSYLCDWIVSDNYIYRGTYGIYLLANASASNDIYIWNNYIDYNSKAIFGEGEGVIKNLQIQDNKIEESSQHSIHFKNLGQTNIISGNMISDSGHSLGNDNTYDGIYIESVETESELNKYESLKIEGNVVRIKHTTSYGTDRRTRYGLNIVPTLDNLWIENNYFEGASGGWNLTSGSNCQIKGNVLGTIADNVVTYKLTENSGTETGTSPITITHGLAETPNVVLVTPSASAGDFYTTNWGDTTFQIVFAGGGSVQFHWYAEYRP